MTVFELPASLSCPRRLELILLVVVLAACKPAAPAGETPPQDSEPAPASEPAPEPGPAPEPETKAPWLSAVGDRFGHLGFSGDVAKWARIPGSERVAVGYSSGALRVWDLATDTPSPPLPVHSPRRLVQLCANANALVSADDEGEVRWSTLDGRATTKGLSGPWCQGDAELGCGLDALRCAKGSDAFAIVGHDGTLHVGAGAGKIDHVWTHDRVLDAALAPDGSRVVMHIEASDHRVVLSLWEAPFDPAPGGALPLVCPFPRFDYAPKPMLRFSPGSELLAAGFSESLLPSKVCLWSFAPKAPKPKKVPTPKTITIATPPDMGGYTAMLDELTFTSATELEGELRYGHWGLDEFFDYHSETLTWDPTTATVASRRPIAPTPGSSPKLDASGPSLRVTPPTGPPRLLPKWESDDASRSARIEGLALAPDNTRVYVQRGESLMIWEGAPPRLSRTLSASFPKGGASTGAIVSDDGARSLHGYANVFSEINQECDPHDLAPGGLVRVDLDAGDKATILDEDKGAYYPLAFLPGTHKALVCRERFTYDVDNHDCDTPLPPRRVELVTLDLGLDPVTETPSPVSSDSCPRQLGLALAADRIVAFQPKPDRDEEDGYWDSEPVFIEVVTLSTGALVFHSDEPREVVSAALSADGTRLAVLSEELVELYEVDGGRRVQSFDLRGGPEGAAVAVPPDGQALVLGLSNGAMRLWREGDTGLSSPPRAHSLKIEGLRFSADGRSLYSRSEDRMVLRWPTPR